MSEPGGPICCYRRLRARSGSALVYDDFYGHVWHGLHDLNTIQPDHTQYICKNCHTRTAEIPGAFWRHVRSEIAPGSAAPRPPGGRVYAIAGNGVRIRTCRLMPTAETACRARRGPVRPGQCPVRAGSGAGRWPHPGHYERAALTSCAPPIRQRSRTRRRRPEAARAP